VIFQTDFGKDDAAMRWIKPTSVRIPEDVIKFTLSPRERAGVRGNGTMSDREICFCKD
jgi:hypothetical protein